MAGLHSDPFLPPGGEVLGYVPSSQDAELWDIPTILILSTPLCIYSMPLLLCLYDVQLNNSCKCPPKKQIIAFQCQTVLVSRMQNKWGFKPVQWRYIHTHACSGYYKCSDSRISIPLSEYSVENKNWPLLSHHFTDITPFYIFQANIWIKTLNSKYVYPTNEDRKTRLLGPISSCF